MEKKKKKEGKEVGRREFVKKMAYLAPAVAILVIPKYTAAQASCHPFHCPQECVGGRCASLTP